MRVVCVHGIGKQVDGERTLLGQWLPALQDGLTRAGAGGVLADDEVGMAFYGNLYRPSGQALAVGDPLYRASDVADGLETELLLAWWAEAARTDPQVVPPDADTLVRTPRSVQTALRALSCSRFLANVTLSAMVFDLKQVARYLTDPVVRAAAQARVLETITERTRVVVAHSLGSVVAYEALHRLRGAGSGITGRGVRALVTLGSPLGIPNLVFHRLRPAPVDGMGSWPGDEHLVWTNLADAGDVVALVKDLRPRFGPRVDCWEVHNDVHAHDVGAYLTDERTGAAIAAGLG